MTRTGVSHPVFARVYERLSRAMESRGVGEHRDELLAGLSGRVIEVGAGNGMNFAHYPALVSEIVAVEPEPVLRRAALREAEHALVNVRVVDGLADALPAPDASFDAAVASLVLCSVADLPAALAELWRVVKPGGEVRFYEHVRSDRAWEARLQDAVDVVWPHVAGGCHQGRDSLAELGDAGFVIESLRRFRSSGAPHVIGTARREP